MAVNKRYMVVGKWYGQRWADADFEVWESVEAAKRSLLVRDNMNWDTHRELVESHIGSELHRIGKVEDTRFIADSDNDARYIDIYGFEMEYNQDTMSWEFLIGEPWYRLELGPRGGVRKEML